MVSPEDLERAIAELREKSLAQIHYETAMLWLARAIAAHRMFLLQDTIDYAHEALEHAALSTDGSSVVAYVETALLPLRIRRHS